MTKQNIIARVLAIQKTGSKELRNELLYDLKEEAFETARRHCRKYGKEASDDEYSVALDALNKAIDSYSPEKNSNFEAFAQKVITFKLIDFFRETRKEKEYVSLEDDKITLISDHKLASEYKNKEVTKDLEEQRREELVRFIKILNKYGYSWVDIMENRPKHKDSLESLQKIALHIVNLGLGQRFLEENPISRKLKKMIGEGIKRKTLIKYRPYLTAIIIALTNDFPVMKSYLDFFKGEGRGNGECSKDSV